MAILDMKAHRLYYYSPGSGGYEDEDGLWHKGGDGEYVRYLKCNAVPAGQPNEITYEDGSTEFYSYTIILGPKCKDFVKGDKIKVEFWERRPNERKEKEFVVKGFQRYQHQCKIWV